MADVRLAGWKARYLMVGVTAQAKPGSRPLTPTVLVNRFSKGLEVVYAFDSSGHLKIALKKTESSMGFYEPSGP